MKIKGLFSYPLIATVLLTTAVSCKKKDDSPTCRIVTVTDAGSGTPTTINLTYNNDGKISTITSTGGSQYSKVFTYSGSNISITEKNGSGILQNTYDVSLNSSGLISSIIEKNAAAVVTYTLTAQYDGNGNLLKLITQNTGSSPSTTTTSFSGGDLTSFTDGTNTGSFEYYTDKSFQDGDYLKLQQIIQYGALYIVNKHLVKSQTYGSSSITNFNYEYTDGRISKVTSTSGSTVETVTYQYTCN